MFLGTFLNTRGVFAQTDVDIVSVYAKEETSWYKSEIEGQDKSEDTDFRLLVGGQASHRIDWETFLASQSLTVDHGRSLENSSHSTDVGANLFFEKTFKRHVHSLTLFGNYGEYHGSSARPFSLWLTKTETDVTIYRRIGAVFMSLFSLWPSVDVYVRPSTSRHYSTNTSIVYGLAVGLIVRHTERLTSTLEGFGQKQTVSSPGVEDDYKVDTKGASYQLAYDATYNTKVSGRVGKVFVKANEKETTVDLYGMVITHETPTDEDSFAVEKTVGNSKETDAMTETNGVTASRKRQIDFRQRVEMRLGFSQEKTIFDEANRKENRVSAYGAYYYLFGQRVRPGTRGFSSSVFGDYRFDSSYVNKDRAQKHTLGIGITHYLL